MLALTEQYTSNYLSTATTRVFIHIFNIVGGVTTHVAIEGGNDSIVVGVVVTYLTVEGGIGSSTVPVIIKEYIG